MNSHSRTSFGLPANVDRALAALELEMRRAREADQRRRKRDRAGGAAQQSSMHRRLTGRRERIFRVVARGCPVVRRGRSLRRASSSGPHFPGGAGPFPSSLATRILFRDFPYPVVPPLRLRKVQPCTEASGKEADMNMTNNLIHTRGLIAIAIIT